MPLTREELGELLGQPILAHLAVTRKNGHPHVTPIWVVYEGGEFYFTSRWRRVKGRAIRRTPDATLSIGTNDRPYRAVIAEGPVTEVKDRRTEWLRRIASKYGQAEGERWLTYSQDEPDRVVLKLTPRTLLTWHYGRGDYRRQNEGQTMRTSF
jgi:hypothetical protein